MLETIWKIRAVRITTGLFLIIVGLIGGVLPVIPGFILYVPGTIILLKEMPFLRIIAARVFKRTPGFKSFFRIARDWVYRKTGFKITFKKKN